ncbi:MAG: hypothetical protein ACRCW2_13940 [Cellulosilyticaceae bacterium]
MYMNRFLIGAIVGGSIGVACTAYVKASAQEKKQFAQIGKKIGHMI